LFIAFAPAENPKSAMAIVLEHNGHTVRNLDTPLIGRDIMTFLYDRPAAMKSLHEAEPTWGGTYRERQAAQAEAFKQAQQAPPPPAPEDAAAAASNVAAEAGNATITNTVTNAAEHGSPESEE
jgi:penicillin-binding protein 2